MSHTPLRGIDGWSPRHIELVAEVGITSAEQLVAVAATPEGVAKLAAQLREPVAHTRELVRWARDVIPPERLAIVETAVDPSDYGLGALPPPHVSDERQEH